MTNNWKTYKLGEVADVIDSLHKTPKYSDFGYPMVRAQEIVGGNLDISNTAKVSKDVYEDFSKNHKSGIGDLVFSRVGAHCGKISYVNTDIPFCLGQNTAFVLSKTIDNRFLYYLLKSNQTQEQLTRNAVVSSYKTISLQTLRELDLNIPPLPEQKAIANILSAIDDKIENNLAINKTLEDMAMALYKHWFVDFEFPITKETHPELVEGSHAAGYKSAGGTFVESELGLIPEGWEVKRLDDLGNMYYGKMPKKDMIQTSGYPLYSGYKYVGHYPEYNCKKGKVIVVARGVGGTGDIKRTKEDLFLTNISICIENGLNLISDLILFYMLKFSGLHYLRTGSAQPQITINDLNIVELIVPSKEIQIQFLDVFDKIIEKKENNLSENETLTKLRNALLPKLISGEVRLKEFRGTLEVII